VTGSAGLLGDASGSVIDWRLISRAGTPAQHKIAITDQERSDMLALTGQMKMGDVVPMRSGSARGQPDRTFVAPLDARLPLR
jgi:hypothetical protein